MSCSFARSQLRPTLPRPRTAGQQHLSAATGAGPATSSARNPAAANAPPWRTAARPARAPTGLILPRSYIASPRSALTASTSYSVCPNRAGGVYSCYSTTTATASHAQGRIRLVPRHPTLPRPLALCVPTTSTSPWASVTGLLRNPTTHQRRTIIVLRSRRLDEQSTLAGQRLPLSTFTNPSNPPTSEPSTSSPSPSASSKMVPANGHAKPPHDHPPEPTKVAATPSTAHKGNHTHSHASGVEHGHDHHGGMFHSHDHAGDAEGMQLLVEALQGKGGRGANITLLGALSNILLTVGKAVAGWTLNSAALVADAGHSAGDLLGDAVTLATWTTSRRPPDADYPYGYGKYESAGTVAISLLLIGAAYYIGQHSLILTLAALEPFMQAATTPAAAAVLEPLAQSAKAVVEADPESLALDPNAAWFALISLGVKEWMYRLTKKVAEEENSTVLAANAYHHRSDAWTSGVALVAILGTWAGVPAMDPIGGLLVSMAIAWQGAKWGWRGMADLLDQGVPASERIALAAMLTPLAAAAGTPTAQLLAIRNVRAVKSGSQLFVDLTADVPPMMTMREAHEVERCIRETLMEERKEIKEVRVHLHVESEGVEKQAGERSPPC